MLKRLFVNDDGGLKPWANYAVVALVIVGGGYFVYAAWTSGEKPLQGKWVCMYCNCIGTKTPEVGGDVPAGCPKCGKQGFVPGYSCPKCKTPVVLNAYRNLPGPAKCPKCGHEVKYGQ